MAWAAECYRGAKVAFQAQDDVSSLDILNLILLTEVSIKLTS